MIRDYLGNEEFAQELVRTIESYWHDRGYAVKVRLEPAYTKHGGFAIRSNMVNGMPLTRLVTEDAAA